MSACPQCKSSNTMFNAAFSWENGAGEIHTCRDCGHTWDLDDAAEQAQLESESVDS